MGRVSRDVSSNRHRACRIARRNVGAAVLLAVLTLIPRSVARAQASPCDEGLKALAHGTYGYALRGDRCEGLYAQPVGGTVLWVASLTESFEEYEVTSGTALTIAWSAPGDREVKLRAQGIKAELFFRMDAARSAGTHSYRWPSDLLAAQHILRDDIGLLGWTRYAIGGIERDVYLPLRLSQHDSSATAGVEDLVLYPTAELREVYVSLSAVGQDGHTVRAIRQGQRLGYGYYPAERPVHIKLREVKDSGLYYVEIAADLTGGGSATVTFWLYHASS